MKEILLREAGSCLCYVLAREPESRWVSFTPTTCEMG